MPLTIYPRASWRAARRRGSVQSRPAPTITELFVHWPGASGALVPPGGWTRTQEQAIMRQLQAGHFANGWSDIGYSHVMFPNGGADHRPRIYTARGLAYTPAAQAQHNSGTCAIMVYMGPGDSLTADILARLRSYVRWVDGKTGRTMVVRAHGDVFATECPGRALRTWVRGGRHR